MEDDKGEVHELTVPKKEGEKAAENGEAESNSTHVADSRHSGSAEGSSPTVASSSGSVAEEVKKEEKEFTLTNLEAVDLANTSRTAKAGETLYYISNKSTENTKFEITINPKLPTAEIEKDRIQWTYNTAHLAEGDGKIKVEKSIIENDNAEVNVKAGYPILTEKSVNVKWVEAQDLNMDLFQKFNMVIYFLQEFNSISKKFGSYLPCTFSALNNFDALKREQKVSFNIRKYNEEDARSRELNDALQVSLKLKSANLAALKCSKSIGIGPISIGDVYVSGELGANLDFAFTERITNESKKSKPDGNVSGGLTLTIKGGLETNSSLKDYIYATAYLNVATGTKTIYPYKNDISKVGSYFYVGNTNLTINGNVINWLDDGNTPFHFNWVLLNTELESKTKLIFDLKKGDIYLTEDE